MKLISWNVNGVRAAVKKGAAEVLASLDADVICLQEIKAKPEQMPQEILNLPGYTPYICSAERPGYSGVAVLTRTAATEVAYGLGVERFDREGRTLILYYADFQLINCYFPNGGSGPERLQFKMDFYEEMLRYAGSCSKPLIVCGDVNTAHREIDLARPKENEKVSGFLPQERDWIDRFLAAGFLDTYRLFHGEGGRYSWWDMKTRARERNVGWRIDYFFASRVLQPRLRNADLLPEIMGSDHCPVTLELV